MYYEGDYNDQGPAYVMKRMRVDVWVVREHWPEHCDHRNSADDEPAILPAHANDRIEFVIVLRETHTPIPVSLEHHQG